MALVSPGLRWHVKGKSVIKQCNLHTTVNPQQFFSLETWWINEFGGITGYSLVLVCYIGILEICCKLKHYGG